jgi:HEPN domain-containing protein
MALEKGLGILKAAKDDYENGYLFDTRTLIEAEVFDEFLEQAEELFKKGYYQPAAVIAGCVLEDGLRKLCVRNSTALSLKATIEPMNVELAKAGIYNKLIQKKITALADLRNKAAHGEWLEFTEKDVEDMIRDVRRFMEDYFS